MSAVLSPVKGALGGDDCRLQRCEAVVEKMVELGIELKDVDVLPLAVAVPIRECLWACR